MRAKPSVTTSASARGAPPGNRDRTASAGATVARTSMPRSIVLETTTMWRIPAVSAVATTAAV
ncbi:hypothetical protein ACWC3X_03200 [Streptomyces populi]